MSGIKNIKKKLKGFQVRPPNAEVMKKGSVCIFRMWLYFMW